MKSGIKVGDIMTRNFISARPDASILEAIKIMSKKRVGSVLVLEKRKLLGILTERDIIDGLAKNKNIMKKKVKDVMKKNPVTISPSKDIIEAVTLINKKGIRRLPVVVKKDAVGMLTMKDILKIHPGLFDISIQKMKIAEEEEKWRRIKAIDDERWVKEGPCDECGANDILYRFRNRYVCGICKSTMEEDNS